MRAMRVCFAVAILLVAASGMFGQSGSTGSILGSVKDSTGAVVSGATVVVTNTATGVVSNATSTTTGTTRFSV